MKTIKFIISVLMIFFSMSGYGQTCKVEFYVLNRIVETIDSSSYTSANFLVTIDDLEETAFIADNEITSFYIQKYITKNNKTLEQHFFIVPKTVIDRINEQEIPLCCGKQFALLVNGNIVYGGYFWNFYSSFGCEGIVAFAFNEKILIERKLPDYGYENEKEEETDMRNNQNLFDCLKSTDRMKDNE